VNIVSEKFRIAVDQAGVSVEELAAAIEREGLSGPNAIKAVRNWMAGRNHPRARAEDISALAAAVGVDPKDISRFVSKSRFMRSSARKARLVADMIRGKQVLDAQYILRFSDKRAADMMLKTLNTAIADAEQADAAPQLLYVTESRVDEGATIKRFQPKDRGRAHPIRKRSSHLIIGVEEVA
jgi:large subunit ribosomal protein L22